LFPCIDYFYVNVKTGGVYSSQNISLKWEFLCLQGSMAYVKGLEKVQIVTKEEMDTIIKGLEKVYYRG
jgi:argininosuccinate lyase